MLDATNSLKTRVKNGETLTGIFVSELRTANYGSLLNAAGCDFAVFDLEHCPFTMADLSNMLPGFHGFRVQPMVRVPAIRREFFQPLLDLGISGIMVPMVESPEDVRTAFSLIKYLPQGKRGIHFSTPHTSFQCVDRDDYVHLADNSILLVIQIETVKGLDNLEAILAEPGIDVVFVGNADLAASIGVPNDLSESLLNNAFLHILHAAKAHGIVGGGNFLDPKFAVRFYNDGLRFITIDSETSTLIAGLRHNMESVRAALSIGDETSSAAIDATNNC